MRTFGYSDHIEKTMFLARSRQSQCVERPSNIKDLRSQTYNFFTCFPQKLWKIAVLPVVFLLLLSLSGPLACSSSKGIRKPQERFSQADKGLAGSGPELVKKKLGEPTTVSRTPEGHILWVYEPTWKLLPNEKGTVYVEFENEKVTKVFKIR